MNDYQRIQDYLLSVKVGFDEDVTNNPNLTLKQKQSKWETLQATMKPTAARLRAIEDELEYGKRYQEAQRFERENARILRRLA